MTNGYYAHRLRRGRTSIPGQIYHVTTTALDRELQFLDIRHARAVIRTLMKSDALRDSDTLAFVLMPDHLHWLFVLGAGRSMSRVVQKVKSSSARLIGHAVWQKGFHDRALRAEQDVRQVARYIIANPVRSGLVEHVADYPHWDAVWL
ncbi:MAG TPA: transposase [Methyloversatilis sp.]